MVLEVYLLHQLRAIAYWLILCQVLATDLLEMFNESFHITYESVRIKCYRSPQKEARMLDLVRGDARFMQGRTAKDAADNPVRIIDIISGMRIDTVVANIKTDHETYFHEHFPAILNRFIGACEAIGHLHDQGEQHGDISLDHLMREHGTGELRWIDFDYAYETQANPFALDLFGLGRMLGCIMGKWIHTVHTLHDFGLDWADLGLDANDFSCVHKNEIMNLRKLFPYIPERLNRVLLHFSEGAEIGYDTVAEFVGEMKDAVSSSTSA